MIPISKPFKFVGETVFGKTHIQTRQYFEIEMDDQKYLLPNWLGYGNTTKRFSASDIGKIVCKHTDNAGWLCWTYANKSKEEILSELDELQRG